MNSKELHDYLYSVNDTLDLEYFLTHYEEVDNFRRYDCDEEIINIVENILPLHSTPLKANVTGFILIKDNETIDQVNQRQLKYIISGFKYFTKEGWDRLEVTIPQSSLCYDHSDPKLCRKNFFTKADLQLAV